MRVVELLAPAGNMECLKAAVNAGADAVYIGGKNFGARSLAQNFSDEELKEAIKYCHLYDVKVHITINTIIYDDEIEELIKYISFINSLGVDAVIVQDLGVINIIRQRFKDLEIHASTQINTHNKETIEYLKKLGVKRVVFGRETSIEEIKNIDVDIEKEVFIHGALCVSYSGQCLFSEIIGGRSGNRGLCAGPCRLNYKLFKEHNGNFEQINTKGEYLLSTKDLCTIEHLDKILESGVDSLKIEGRMKKSEYVYLVVSIYRKAIDNYYKYKETRITKEDIEKLKIAFNRDFTKGFILNEKGFDINNSYRPNHMGIEIGKVIGIQNHKVKIKLSNDLTQGDGIRILNSTHDDVGFIVNKIYKNNLYIRKGHKNDIIELDVKENIDRDSVIIKTSSIELEKEIEFLMKKEKKVPIKMHFTGRIGKKLELIAMDNRNNIVKTISNLEAFKAEKLPVTKPDIYNKLSRTNHTPFRLQVLDISLDHDLFIPIKEVNEIKRTALEQLEKLRIQNYKTLTPDTHSMNVNDNFPKQEKTFIKCLVKTEEQLKACIDQKVDYIYAEEELYNKYKDKYSNLILVLPRINKTYKEYTNIPLLIRELGSLEKYKDQKITTDYTFNITNSYSIYLLNDFNVNTITLSTELKDKNLNEMLKKFKNLPNLELIIYGNIEAMITKYCILNKHINDSLKPCNICKNKDKYYLVDRKDEKYRILTDNMCNNIIMSSKKINLIGKLNYYKELGIKNFRLQFLDESYDDVVKILSII